MNSELLVRGLLGLSVLIYACIGLWTAVDPVAALAPVGVVPIDDRGLVELRAMYGGLQLGMAAFLAWCLAAPTRVRIGLTAAVLTIGGLGVIRTLAALMLAPTGTLIPLLCAIELGGAALGACALAWDARNDPKAPR